MANEYLSLQRFPGDGVTTDFTVNFAGGTGDNQQGTQPYINIADVKAYELVPSVGTTPSQRIPRDVEILGPLSFRIAPAVPVGRILEISRETEDRHNLVDFKTLQTVSEFDLDLAVRQLLYVTQESSDRSSLAFTGSEEANLTAAEALDVASGASVQADSAATVAGQALSRADTAINTSNNALSTANTALVIANDAMAAVQEAGVASFNGRAGVVVPVAGDYSADMVSFGAGTVEVELKDLDTRVSGKATIGDVQVWWAGTGNQGKLDSVEEGAQVNEATNLGATLTETSVTITSSTGTSATVPAATTTQAGVMTAADKAVLSNLGTAAVADVTQSAGQSTEDVLSQKAVTDLLAGKAALNASDTVSGGLKVRLLGTTLYITNDGSNP